MTLSHSGSRCTDHKNILLLFSVSVSPLMVHCSLRLYPHYTNVCSLPGPGCRWWPPALSPDPPEVGVPGPSFVRMTVDPKGEDRSLDPPVYKDNEIGWVTRHDQGRRCPVIRRWRLGTTVRRGRKRHFYDFNDTSMKGPEGMYLPSPVSGPKVGHL